MVSGGFFRTLLTSPSLGRLIAPEDGDTPVAVYSHDFWRSALGADSTVIGRPARIGSVTYTIVGIAAQGFTGVEAQPIDVWIPVTVAAERDLGIPLGLYDRGSAWLSVIGRLREEATRENGELQATNVWREGYRGDAEMASAQIEAASVILGRGPDRPREANVTLWLSALSMLLLLLACTNAANLVLVRAVARQREVAVRLALGASRTRLARQFVTEGVALAGMGGAAALVIGMMGGAVIQRVIFPFSRAEPVLSVRLMLITVATSILAAGLVSLTPLIQSRTPDLIRSLRTGDTTTGIRSERTLLSLLGVQAGLCMTMLVLAALVGVSLRRVRAIDLGMDPERTLLARVDLSGTAMSRPAFDATWDEMRRGVAAIDGVDRVALAWHDPFTYGSAIPAHTRERGVDELWHEGVRKVPKEVVVDSGFFRTLGTALRGRDFESQDRPGAPLVAIINEPLARLLWPRGDVLNQCLLIEFDGGPCVQVVGVVGGFLRRGILSRDELAVYLPLAQRRLARPGSMVVAVSGDPEIVAARIQTALQRVRPDMPAVSVRMMSDVLRPQFRPWELAAIMLSLFGAVALLIGVAGLYAVVQYAAVLRARETAIRVALGAGFRGVLHVVAAPAILAVIAGLIAGGLATLALRRFVGPFLFQTSPLDPKIIYSVGGLLLLTAAAASVLPIIRILRRNPAVALRSEDI